MSNTKHLADILKVCSILPALVVMPVMAEVPEVSYTGVVTGVGSGNTVSQAMYFNPEQDLIFKNTLFSGNKNTAMSGNMAFGTVVFSNTDATLTFDNAVFENNQNSYVGGAIANFKNAKFVVENSKFIGNHAYYDGGAIGNYGGLVVKDSLFEGNTADYDYNEETNDWSIVVEDSTAVGGGAISLGAISDTTVGSIVGTIFKNNKSGTYGGAIGTRFAQNSGSSKNSNTAKLDIAATFIGNEALKDGGAIYNTFWNSNDLGKGDGVTVTGVFEENKAGGYGGAIFNDGRQDLNGKGGVMTINGGEFEENQASLANGYGGAIFNFFGDMSILGDENTRVVFEDNAAYVGGAFSDRQVSSSYAGLVSNTLIKHALFEENHAVADAGAAGFYGDVTVEDVIFRGNTAAIDFDGVKADVGNSDGGGAVQVGGTANVTLKDVYFAENESGARGGAIAARHGTKYTLDIDTATFTSNKSAKFGGGIANVFGGAVDMNDVNFVSNYAGKAGGAIFNGKDMNYGGSEGALSTNHGILNFSGSNTFVGNRAEEFGGAIYNDNGGTINMSGTNVFADNTQSGIANDIYNLGALNVKSGTTTLDGGIAGNGSLTIAEGATLNIGTAAIEQANVILDGTLIATVREGDAQLNIADMFDGKGSIKLALTGEGTYHVFGGQVFDSVDVSSAVYDLSWSEDSKNLIAVMKSVDDIAVSNGLTGNAAQMIANVSNSTSEALNNLGVKIQEVLATGDAKAVEVANKAINPEKTSVVQSTAVSVQNTVSTLAANRMSTVASVGRSGGDAAMTSGGVWAQGLYNKTKLNGEFNGYTRGVAVGVDGTINDDIMVGAGYAFNNSDISSVSRDMDVDTHSVFVYGQYKPAAWYVNAMLNYTMSDYTETGDALGIALGSDYETDAFGGQITAGYDFDGGITPEFGVRYLHINSTDYTNSIDVKNELDSADYLTVVLGTKYGVDFEANNGLKLRPEIRYAVKYDMISDKSSMTVAMPGVAAYTLSGERLSRVGGEFGIGLTMKYNELDLSLSYDIEVREDYTSQTGMIKARYNF